MEHWQAMAMVAAFLMLIGYLHRPALDWFVLLLVGAVVTIMVLGPWVAIFGGAASAVHFIWKFW